MNKAELRAYMKKVRKSLSPARIIAYSNEILLRLSEEPCYREADVILSYVSFSSEVDTRFLMRKVLQDGKILAVPKCGNDAHQMDFYRITDTSELAPGHYGILEPTTNDLVDPKDGRRYLLILPGLAFDEKKNRLGYGGGYYDSFLERYPGIFTVMIAYELQKVETVETESFDIPADLILTEINRYE